MADGYTSDGSYDEIKITITPRDFSKMTPEELIEFDKKLEEQNRVCAYCMSLGKEAQGHTKDDCKLLQNTRCNWCGDYGHTGKFCEKKGEKPLDIRCLFCFRGKKDERFYMSHSIDNCRFRREYEQTRPRPAFNKPSYNKPSFKQPNIPQPTESKPEPKTSSLDENGLNLVRRFPLPESENKRIENQTAVSKPNTTRKEPETEKEQIDPILQALQFFNEEMKKSQPKMYEPTSPEPLTEKEYLMMLHQQNQMMLGKLRAMKK